MTSNKIFLAGNFRKYSDLLRPPLRHPCCFRRRRFSTSSSSGADIFRRTSSTMTNCQRKDISISRVHRELCSTLNQRMKQLESPSSKASASANSVSLISYHQRRANSKSKSSPTRSPIAIEVEEELIDPRNMEYSTMLPETSSPTAAAASIKLEAASSFAAAAAPPVQQSKEERKLSALRQRFRTRLQTYLRACVLAALRRNNGREKGGEKTKLSKTAQRRQVSYYLEAAYGALRHYNDCIEKGSPKPFVSLDDPELFNTVLLGWIHGAGDIWYPDVRDRCSDVRKIMRKRNVQPNEATLACFYLLLNLPVEIRNRVNRKADDYYQAEINRIVEELKKHRQTSAGGRVGGGGNEVAAAVEKFLADPRLTKADREILRPLFERGGGENNNPAAAPAAKSIKVDFGEINRYERGRPILKSLNEPYGGLVSCVVQGLSTTTSSSNQNPGPYGCVFFNDDDRLMDDFRTQLEGEKRGVIEVPSAYVSRYAQKNVYDLLYDRIQDHWRARLAQTFQERKTRHTRVLESRMTYGGLDSYKVNIAPFLSLLEPEMYVEVMMDEAIRLSTQVSDVQGLPLRILCRNLGRRLMGKVKIELADQYGLIDKIDQAYQGYLKYFLDWRRYEGCNHREFWSRIITEQQQQESSLESSNNTSKGSSSSSSANLHADMLPCQNDWLLYELGEFLCEIMLDSLKVPASLTDAVHQKRQTGSKRPFEMEQLKLTDAYFKAMSSYGLVVCEEIRAHTTLSALQKRTVPRTIRFDPYEVPSICPPIPWYRSTAGTKGEGQLLITPIDLVRLEPIGAKSLENTQCIRAELEDLHPVMDALNVLGSTPWTINRPVLNVMLEIFRSGKGDMKLAIPPARKHLPPVPEFPSKKNNLSQEERVAMMKRRQEVKKTNAELFGLWCTAHYRFSLAEFLKDRVIWFPHNVDFRGRTYPVPPLLNHMGDDTCRGLMQFAQGRPLGSRGLYWLKVHLINLTGLRKRSSLDERAAYADEIMDDILDSARKPLDGRRWWTQSEEPWQTLAVCMEIEKATSGKGKPEEYVCHVPVHQDGSCNGLQHYAALGRDKQGALQVNLEPSGLPQDVYSAVAAKIEQKRAIDADAGLEIAQILDGYVRRKVIKQTVMTTVYGVTRYGGKAQIMRQLKDIDTFPKEHAFKASAYLVERLFESIGEIFSAAGHIQDWLVKSSRLISGRLGKTVEWVTPLGFPVAQPYFKCLNSCRSFGTEDRLSDASTRPFPINYVERPNSYKQSNAFPPNYIHSLDSTHMMLTALHCHRQGLAYAAVHDSYWTHPSTIGTMNEICRQQFVALHSQPLLQQLSEFFIHRYIESELANLRKAGKLSTKDGMKRLTELQVIREHFESLPQLGQFDLKAVQDSRYFFC